MNKFTKLFALALSSVFAVSLFAGCGERGGTDNGGDQSGTQQGGTQGGNEQGGTQGGDSGNEGGGTQGGNEQGGTQGGDSGDEGGGTQGGDEGGGTQGGDSGNEGGEQGGTDTPDPSLPTPDKTVSSFGDQDVTLTLDGRTNKYNYISDSLFGVFLEDINYAGYLLDDNLLPNGSFETITNGTKTWCWTPVGGAEVAVESSNGVLKNETEYGAQKVNANYAKLTAAAAGDGISSVGHPQLPIAVEKDVEYTFSAFVKSEQAANMKISVKDENSSYFDETIPVKGGNTWVKYQKTVKASASANSGLTFTLSFDAAGTYYLDGIQLETANAKGGIKQYVYDAIEGLGPKFIRFPGGCIIEGNAANGGADTQVVYDWKNSVGAVQNGTNAGDDTIPAFSYTLVKDGQESTATTQGEWITRKQNGDLWGYDMEYGIGFLEFFELCENVGASAVPVLNCGYSCMGGAARNPQPLSGRHNKKVEDYIQDAVDLIEFAKGDTSTKWGALRAALGHEEPFEMNYLGIGNEQFGDAYYKDCYEKFLQNAAFKKALSDYNIKPIVGNGMFITDCQNGSTKGTAQKAAESAVKRGIVENVSDFGVHDQHYYVNWTTLLANYDMYDEYALPAYDPDTYYGVFVGEYSANTSASGYTQYNNELIAALAEAAMMTSYERNGSVVELAAYAPMFGVADRGSNPMFGGNNSANQWAVDMMYYTNTEIVRTTNYYVQQMFMHNLGASYLHLSKLKWKDEDAETFFFPSSDKNVTDKEFNKLYYVPSIAENGDLLVKVVNVSGEGVKMNVDIKNATGKGFAYVTELANSDYKAINTLKNEAVKPVSSTIGWAGQSFGYEFKPYSLTVLRIPTVQA